MTTGMSAPPIGITNSTPSRESDRRQGKQPVHDLLARVDDRGPGDQLLELPEGDEAAGEGDRTDQHAEHDRHGNDPRRLRIGAHVVQ
jgi:hypothetical protein